MKPNKPCRLLPHEVFFGSMLVILWARLAWATGFFGGYTLLFGSLVLLNIAAVWLPRVKDTPRRWRLWMLFYPLAMSVVFSSLKGAFPKLGQGRMDGFLQHVDTLLIGTNLSLRWQPYIHPVFTEVLSFCYTLFFPYLIGSIALYFAGTLEEWKKFVIGLFSIYGIGFLGYSFVPAIGPYVAMAGQFTVPLTGWWFTRELAAFVPLGTNGVDVFPSLHCAVTSFILFFDRRRRPLLFWLSLAPCAGLWISTIYLRYHYFVDIVCGFALSAFGLWLSHRYPRKELPQT